jgi:hypothetical protein
MSVFISLSYADYLAILNAPEENMVDEYYQNMLEELRTGINTKTGKALTRLEQVQRWSTVASFVAILAIGSYYSVKGLTGTKTTAKQPKSMNKATVPKAKLPSDTTQGRQLKVKKADIPAGKSRNVTVPKKTSGTGNAKLTQESINSKLDGYLLNKEHPVGGSKANWFEKALGFNKNNSQQLSSQIIFDKSKAVQTAVTEYGTKYSQIIPIKGVNGKIIDVEFVWIKNNDGIVRLVTSIPTKK